jgi:hypothetical protein
MKRQRSMQPVFDSLEHKQLLSAGLISQSQSSVLAPAMISETTATGVRLSGGLGDGYGWVSPLGGVRGRLNANLRTLTLSNRRGSLELQLSPYYQHRYTETARAWQVIKGTGQYATLEGSGHAVVNVVRIRGHVVAWSASFYQTA